jgi:hypothetical protein
MAGVTRRGLLASAGASAMVRRSPDWAGTLSTRAAAWTGPGLLQSYDVVQGGTGDFDRTQANCAYVYDNAVAGLALLAAGDRAGAGRIGDALVRAQAHDRFWHDGRLRNAYRAGPVAEDPVKLPGWWDAEAGRWVEDGYQVGTATGVVAWAMLLWIGLGAAYRPAALRAADWLETVRGPRGYRGGFLGFEPHPQALTWVSTEHNTDLYAAFAALGRGDQAAHARAFVESMWLPGEGRFATGLRPDGTVNDHSAVDANLWPLLAADARPEWRNALHWILTRHGLPANGPVAAMDGVDFNDDRDGIWLEGTAITALTAGGNTARFMATLGAQTSPGGLIYACSTPTLTTGLSTGLDGRAPDFLYYRRPHVAPTAWAALAAAGADPCKQSFFEKKDQKTFVSLESATAEQEFFASFLQKRRPARNLAYPARRAAWRGAANPRNRNGCGGRPDRTSAMVAALAPGMAETRCPAARAARTRR